jgi:hypothetical protein
VKQMSIGCRNGGQRGRMGTNTTDQVPDWSDDVRVRSSGGDAGRSDPDAPCPPWCGIDRCSLVCEDVRRNRGSSGVNSPSARPTCPGKTGACLGHVGLKSETWRHSSRDQATGICWTAATSEAPRRLPDALMHHRPVRTYLELTGARRNLTSARATSLTFCLTVKARSQSFVPLSERSYCGWRDSIHLNSGS